MADLQTPEAVAAAELALKGNGAGCVPDQSSSSDSDSDESGSDSSGDDSSVAINSIRKEGGKGLRLGNLRTASRSKRARLIKEVVNGEEQDAHLPIRGKGSR